MDWSGTSANLEYDIPKMSSCARRRNKPREQTIRIDPHFSRRNCLISLLERLSTGPSMSRSGVTLPSAADRAADDTVNDRRPCRFNKEIKHSVCWKWGLRFEFVLTGLFRRAQQELHFRNGHIRGADVPDSPIFTSFSSCRHVFM